MSEPVSPIVNELNAPFWAAAEQGRLVLPVCVETGRCFWPPSPLSPFSGGATAWRDSPGRGILRSLVIYRRVFQKAFEAKLPYGVALVETDEGPRLQAYVANPESPGAARVGDRVAIEFVQVIEGAPKIPVVS